MPEDLEDLATLFFWIEEFHNHSLMCVPQILFVKD